jgi:hypothetical protein
MVANPVLDVALATLPSDVGIDPLTPTLLYLACSGEQDMVVEHVTTKLPGGGAAEVRVWHVFACPDTIVGILVAKNPWGCEVGQGSGISLHD